VVLGIRSIIYVDGISLYYAAQTGTRHRRLDLQGMCARLRPHDDIRTIYYFAVPADGLHGTAEIAYLIPLRPHPVVNIVAGDYEHMSDVCGWVNVRGEVGLDIRDLRAARETAQAALRQKIAVQMLDDAYRNRADRLILVSGDPDLAPALQALKRALPDKEVIICMPAEDFGSGQGSRLRSVADEAWTLPF